MDGNLGWQLKFDLTWKPVLLVDPPPPVFLATYLAKGSEGLWLELMVAMKSSRCVKPPQLPNWQNKGREWRGEKSC